MVKTGQHTRQATLFIVALFVPVFLLPLESCVGAFEAPEQEARRVTLRIAAEGAGARTAMPIHAAQYYYTITASAPEKGIVFRDLGVKTSVELELGPALWQFTVRGYLSPGKAEGPVLFGSGELEVAAGSAPGLTIRLRAGTEAQGVLAFSFGLPQDVSSARMTLAPQEGSPEPFDLLAGDHLSTPGTGALDRPSGVYRVAVNLRNSIGKTALWNSIAHIRDVFTTLVTFAFPENPFISLARFGSIAAFAAWLSEAEPNTADNSYPLELEGINVKSNNTDPNELGEMHSDGLGDLYAAFQGRYIALDMDACTGASIPFSNNSQSRQDQDKLIYLVLPRTLTGIGGNSFTNCVNLKNVVFPDSLQWIRQNAFSGCVSLESLEFPAALEWLEGSFLGCASLKTIVCHAPVPPQLKYSGEFGGGALESIYVPSDSVEAYKIAAVWKNYAALIEAIPSGNP
jgi:hypothetical protein